ncbi:hypothetical protein HDE78_003610 [Rhodanobacter sp. K2T2]|nr:hypothetical protein [Rhodanobacter sp. K2T2]
MAEGLVSFPTLLVRVAYDSNDKSIKRYRVTTLDIYRSKSCVGGTRV